MTQTEKLLDFVEARLEMTYAYGLSALEWNREDVAKQILQTFFDFLLTHKEYQRRWKGGIQILFGFSPDELDELRGIEL